MLDDTRPRVYTRHNMHDTKVQSLFNYAAIDDPWWRYLIHQERLIDNKKEYITLGEIYDAFDAGLTFDQVLHEIKSITPQSALLGRAFYMANNPEGYSSLRNKQHLRVLCDENCDERAVTDGAREVFGYASHTSFDELTGQPDSKVWVHSVGRYDLIVTKDKNEKKSRKAMEKIDLTRCATLRWFYFLKEHGIVPRHFPVMLHVMDHEATGPQIRNMLRKHRDSIFEVWEERSSPIIEMDARKVVPGKTAADILEQYDPTYEMQPRDKMWEDAWFRMIVKGRNLTEDEETHIRKTIKNAARQSIQMSRMPDILELPIRERAKARRECVYRPL